LEKPGRRLNRSGETMAENKSHFTYLKTAGQARRWFASNADSTLEAPRGPL
jgi:hypothetical protein